MNDPCFLPCSHSQSKLRIVNTALHSGHNATVVSVVSPQNGTWPKRHRCRGFFSPEGGMAEVPPLSRFFLPRVGQGRSATAAADVLTIRVKCRRGQTRSRQQRSQLTNIFSVARWQNFATTRGFGNDDSWFRRLFRFQVGFTPTT